MTNGFALNLGNNLKTYFWLKCHAKENYYLKRSKVEQFENKRTWGRCPVFEDEDCTSAGTSFWLIVSMETLSFLSGCGSSVSMGISFRFGFSSLSSRWLNMDLNSFGFFGLTLFTLNDNPLVIFWVSFSVSTRWLNMDFIFFDLFSSLSTLLSVSFLSVLVTLLFESGAFSEESVRGSVSPWLASGWLEKLRKLKTEYLSLLTVASPMMDDLDIKKWNPM